jgi:membrane protease subunit (stomatin/prohibitin family)
MVPHLYSSKKEAIESCKALNRTNPDKGVVSFSIKIVDPIDFIYQLAGREVDKEEIKTTEKNGWSEEETISLKYIEE